MTAVTIASQVQIMWLASETFSATQANPSTGVYTATITGSDETIHFPVGSGFLSSVDAGNKIVSAVAFTGGDTVITTANTLTPGAATLTVAYKWINYTWAKLSPAYSNPGYRITDRYGQLHRIAPASATAKQRYCQALSVKLLQGDLLATASDGTTLPALLDTYAIDADTEFIILHQEDHVNNDGVAVSFKRAYKCYLDDVPSEPFGTLSVIGSDDLGTVLNFTCHSDGTFTHINNPAGASWRTRPT